MSWQINSDFGDSMGMDLDFGPPPVMESIQPQQSQQPLQFDPNMQRTRSLDWTRTVVALVIALISSLVLTVVVLVAVVVYLLRMSP